MSDSQKVRDDGREEVARERGRWMPGVLGAGRPAPRPPDTRDTDPQMTGLGPDDETLPTATLPEGA